MRQYILRRILLIIPTMIGVTMVVSLLTELLPGDFIDVLLADHVGQGEDVEALRAKWKRSLGLGSALDRSLRPMALESLAGRFGNVADRRLPDSE